MAPDKQTIATDIYNQMGGTGLPCGAQVKDGDYDGYGFYNPDTFGGIDESDGDVLLVIAHEGGGACAPHFSMDYCYDYQLNCGYEKFEAMVNHLKDKGLVACNLNRAITLIYATNN